jgi:hypothetical protein
MQNIVLVTTTIHMSDMQYAKLADDGIYECHMT